MLALDLRNLAAGARAVDPLRQRLPRRLRAGIPVLDRPADVRRGSRARRRQRRSRQRLHAGRPVRRREPARGRPLRRVVGQRPRGREVLGDAGRGHLLPPPLVRAGRRLPEPPARQRRPRRRGRRPAHHGHAAAARSDGRRQRAQLPERPVGPLHLRRRLLPASRRLDRGRDLAARARAGTVGDGALVVAVDARPDRHPPVGPDARHERARAPPAHRAVARIQGRLGHAGAHLVLVARAGPRRRDVARRDQRGRHRRGQRRRGRRA